MFEGVRRARLAEAKALQAHAPHTSRLEGFSELLVEGHLVPLLV